nr:hypothetical protein [Klebsiella pneumoniae subsp. pneumoniae]
MVRAETEQQLLSAANRCRGRRTHADPWEGSNVLFLNDYAGTVILNRIMGIEVSETPEAGACTSAPAKTGINWCSSRYSMRCRSGKSGVNPGCAGSSPIQNIGAYGVELQRVCEYVDCIELETGRKQRLSAAECRFGYRDSIFKHEYQDRYAIVAIGLSLAKTWQPVLSYGDLTRLDPQTVTPQQVFDAVCHMRMTKLPDQRLTVMPAAF